VKRELLSKEVNKYKNKEGKRDRTERKILKLKELRKGAKGYGKKKTLQANSTKPQRNRKITS